MVSINKIMPTRRVQPIKPGNKNSNNKTQQDLAFERSELKDKKNDEALPIKHIDERI
ncbi:MAG: hypothetical protein V7682_10070 [Cycloclasticus sp.]